MKKVLALALFICALAISLSAIAKGNIAKQYGVPAIPREDFNRLAVLNDIPLFWKADANTNGRVEAAELQPVGAGRDGAPYIVKGSLTAEFEKAYRTLVESYRRELVQRELDSGMATLVATDFRGASAADRKLVQHIVRVGRMIDELYHIQKGAHKYLKDIPNGDTGSRALFERNMGPWCMAPKTQDNPACNAVTTFPDKISDAYPADMQKSDDMCDDIGKMKNGKELLSPFVVVRGVKDKFVTLPLTGVYGEKMKAVSAELKEAASVLGGDEAAFKKYLMAAAEGFETNDWQAADEAWVAMNAKNSQWYLRVAPDETYFDPCAEKAGFHLAFAKIDPGSLRWQDKLNPLTKDMEEAIAKISDGAYKARDVKSSFPDFIEIILNSGDSRHNLGAIIGQSLPNWGKVADEGRKRTVVMSNLYNDPDSKRIARQKATSLIAPENMKYYSDDQDVNLIGTILHEATHNFGPYSDYKVNGKGPSEIFGGRTAAVLEELKAQTGSLLYIDFLRKRGVISDQMARQAYTDAIAWCFGHISQGMFNAAGSPKPYSQLCAIDIGSLVDGGAMSFVATKDEGTGEAVEKFRIDYEKIPASIDRLMKRAIKILATGDAADAKALIDNYTTGEGSKLVHMKDIQDRILKFPKASFYYSVRY